MIARAAEVGVALEINASAHRLDLNDTHARLAHDRGARLVISSDSHSHRGFRVLRWGVLVARRAWLEPKDVLNTLPFEAFKAALRRRADDARTQGQMGDVSLVYFCGDCR